MKKTNYEEWRKFIKNKKEYILGLATKGKEALSARRKKEAEKIRQLLFLLLLEHGLFSEKHPSFDYRTIPFLNNEKYFDQIISNIQIIEKMLKKHRIEEKRFYDILEGKSPTNIEEIQKRIEAFEQVIEEEKERERKIRDWLKKLPLEKIKKIINILGKQTLKKFKRISKLFPKETIEKTYELITHLRLFHASKDLKRLKELYSAIDHIESYNENNHTKPIKEFLTNLRSLVSQIKDEKKKISVKKYMKWLVRRATSFINISFYDMVLLIETDKHIVLVPVEVKSSTKHIKVHQEINKYLINHLFLSALYSNTIKNQLISAINSNKRISISPPVYIIKENQKITIHYKGIEEEL